MWEWMNVTPVSTLVEGNICGVERTVPLLAVLIKLNCREDMHILTGLPNISSRANWFERLICSMLIRLCLKREAVDFSYMHVFMLLMWYGTSGF